jgi:3'-phosphoadenosine 5'-phosphosulfate sulfotransferase (PAPS reductase)/FAD synthetase
MALEQWRELIVDWAGEESLPPVSSAWLHPPLGELFPWTLLERHAKSRPFYRAVDQARRVIDTAMGMDTDWRLSVSCGKDSTAMALLCSDDGWYPRAMSIKDDMDYPNEREYLDSLMHFCGFDVDIIEPPSLIEYLKSHRVSLVESTHNRTDEFSAKFFYSQIDRYHRAQQYDGVLLGLRAEESKGREKNWLSRGALYRRKNGLSVAQPLATWTALDVHAFLWSRRIPCLPVYLCVDDEQQALSIRKSWYIAGGGPARHGHYSWLRRWWPDLWHTAWEIDPEVESVS